MIGWRSHKLFLLRDFQGAMCTIYMLLKGGSFEGQGKKWGNEWWKELGKGWGVWVIGMLLFWLMGDSAWGRTLVWVGAGDGVSWSDAANWNPARSPSSGDVVVMEGGEVLDASGASFTGALQLGEWGSLSLEQWGMYGDSSLERALYVSSSLKVMDKGLTLDVGRQGRVLFGTGNGNGEPQLNLGRNTLTISGCLETACESTGYLTEEVVMTLRGEGTGMRLMRRYLMGLEEGATGTFRAYCGNGGEPLESITGKFYDAEGGLMNEYEGSAAEWELQGGREGQYLMGRDERGVYVEFAQMLIPEPGVVGLGAVSLLLLACRRRRG